MKLFFLVLLVSSTLTSPVTFRDVINNKFAASVYKEIVKENEENFLVSPLSALIILGLSQAGAKNETALELQNALKLPQKDLTNSRITNLLQNFNKKHDYIIQTINKIYVKKNYIVKEDYLTLAKKVYNSEIEAIDFESKDAAANSINQWVEDNTGNKIHQLINPKILSNTTRLLLINALRFKGNWSIPFQSYTTTEEDFFTRNNTIKVQTMHLYEENLNYYEKPNLNASFLELPIIGGISMTIVLPETNSNLSVIEDHIDEILESPQKKELVTFNLALPKFHIESRFDFKQILQNLGVKKAFQDGKADFSGIGGEKGELFISDVIQKAFLDVNEDGIEAAAATYIVKIVNRNGESPREFVVNRPFIFFIKIEDVIVLIGRVMIPIYQNKQ